MGAAQGRPAIQHLPFRRNPFFTGREQVLNDLRAMLLASASAALVQPPAISGLGGIGKTETVIEYAYRYQAEYAVILWMQASSRETLITDITHAAALLHLPEQDAREQDKIVQALKHWLEANSGWLLIFDNADDLHVVSDVLPARNSGHILFTTRATAMSDLAQRVPIDEMDRVEGSLLLLRRAKLLSTDAPLTNASPADLAAAQAIVEAVDGLPLALDQAGAYIEETQCSLTDYLQLYQTHLLEERAKRKDAHPEPVATTWAISFKNVQEANPAAADLLRLCAFLAPDDIPEAMFLKAPEDIGSDLQSLVGNLYKLNMAIRELLRYSLIRRDSTNHTIIVHRLVQAVQRYEMDEETRKQWAERAIKIVDEGFPYIEMGTWPLCQQLLPHALVCASFIKQWDLAFPEAARLLSQAGVYLVGRAQYQGAEPLFKQALTIRKEVLGLHHPDTATSLNNLAYLYQAQGKLAEAEPLYKQTLEILKQVLGPDHPTTRTIQSNYDYLLQQMKRDPQ